MEKSNFGRKLLHALRPTKKKVTVLVLLAILAGGGYWVKNYFDKKKAAQTTAAVETDMVTRGDVEVTITGSAAVEPYERYEIISMVSGDIISSPYEVGDQVEKDAVLYQFDTSDTNLDMQKQEISQQQSELNYQKALENQDKLVVRAKASGVVSDLDYQVGDEVEANAVLANIADSTKLEVTLPFTQTQIADIYVGQPATISSSVHMSSVQGTVTHKDANPHAQADGSSLYNVTIAFENPGAFASGLVVGGEIGGMISPGSGEVTYADEGKVTTEVQGTIESLNYTNGDYVTEGAVVATLSSQTIADEIENSALSYENAQLSMKQAQESLQDYTVKSPISGTVITKNAKAGDTIDRTNSTQTLMVVADISRLKFSLEIDELDVSKVQVGQMVSITSDALEGEEFSGVITNVSVEGTATNGVTSYSAEVVIDQPGNLRPSMNIDASVIVESAQDVLLVPTEDIKSIMGKNYVYVKDDASSTQGGQHGGSPEGGGNMPQMPDGAENGMPPQMPDGTENGMPPQMPAGTQTGGMGTGQPQSGGTESEATDGAPPAGGGREIQAPDGFRAVEVQIGVSGDDYTEIISGLQEGDQIQKLSSSTSSNQMPFMMGGGMGGGMGGAVSVSGGGDGGMGGPPSGGGGGMGGGPR